MLDRSIKAIQAAVDQGDLTYEGLVKDYIKLIEVNNEAVNAISELNPNALTQAKLLDEEYRTSGRRSLLHGIPVMIKDNVHVTGDGFHVTAGACIFKDLVPPYEATIATKLKEAGAIILGKTNLSEFANFISQESPNGFSALKGQVKNPYGAFDVGGSSSGSGVAVACCFCQVAIGTETSGSIISPASSNSIIGLKPTVGVASRYGIIPISATQDIPGPMARYLEDIVIVQNIIEGFDVNDLSTQALLKLGDRELKYESLKELKSLRVGYYIEKEDMDQRKASNSIFAKALSQMRKHHIHTQEVTFIPTDYKVDWDVLYYEFPRDMANYLKSIQSEVEVKSLADILKVHQSDVDKYVPYDQIQFEKSVMKEATFDVDYGRALADSFKYGHLIDHWIDTEELDVICYVNCDAIDIAARLGYPSITFPIGYTDDGEPVGFTMSGKGFEEQKLITIAKSLIPIIGKHRPVEDLEIK